MQVIPKICRRRIIRNLTTKILFYGEPMSSLTGLYFDYGLNRYRYFVPSGQDIFRIKLYK